jgi:signal transduction histidine kinase/ligand-binding sensor domain-containing protein
VGLSCSKICSGQSDLRHQTIGTWTIEQGLPQNFVTALDQTPDGFLWVGTMGGLARFDGLNFRTNFPGDPPALHSSITNIGHDGAGQLWVGTASGLLREDRGSFHLVTLPDPGSPHVEHMAVSHDGGVWVDTGQHLWKLNADEKTLQRIDYGEKRIRSMVEDADGTLWLVDDDSVIAVRRTGVRYRFPLPNAGVVAAGADGNIYAGDGHHLFRFSASGFKLVPGTALDEFVDVVVAHDGALWLASGGLQGIARVDAKGMQRLGINEGLASNDARALLEDRSGGMWVGTIAGLQRLHQGTFTPYGGSDGLPPPTAQYDAIFAAASGKVWTGTLQHGIARLEGGHWHTYDTAQGLRRGQVRGFADDGTAMPLVAIADYGLFRWNGHRYAAIAGVPSGYVTAPMRSRDGSVWFSVLRNGVFRLLNKSLVRYAAPEGLTDTTVWSLLEDSAGTLYAGSHSGLFRFDGKQWSRIYPDLHSTVVALRISSRGELLTGTTAGLQILKGGQWQTLGRAQGLPADSVIDIQEDADGSLWLANPVGICRVTRVQIDAFLAHKSATVATELYTERDGLPSRDLLPMSDTLTARAPDGRLWLATTRGPAVGVWRPEPAPRAIVDSVSNDGVVQPQGDVHIAPGRHRVTFSFTAPSFSAPEQLRFRYRLVGWDTGWIEAGKIREVSYAGLPPGTYRFEVKAIGRGDIEGPIADGSMVDLRPFFWQTRAFLLGVLVLLIAMVGELTRRGTMLRARSAARRFEERSAERERIAYEIHDTVIQDLIGATLYLEIAEMELSAGAVDPQRQLGGLAARLRETVSRSRNMVASLHTSAQPQHGLLEALRLSEAEFRMSQRPLFTLTQRGQPGQMDPLLHDEVYRICREAIANAFRHSRAEHIRVDVDFQPHGLLVEIADDGIGMDREMQHNGRIGHFGLPAMRAHSERVGGHLEIESSPGGGTVVRLLIRTSLAQRARRRLRSILQRGTAMQRIESQTPGEP